MDIKAFKGYRYNEAVVGVAGDCIAPPYDVIDSDQQQRLYERSSYNIVRVIKPRPHDPDDSPGSDIYDQAAAALDELVRSGALQQDNDERIYVYVQEFSIQDHTYRRSGFIALGRLEAYGGSVRPHEQTLSGPKTDRLLLMRATRCQIGQIFMLYSDPQRRVDAELDRAGRGQCLLEHTDEDGVAHRLYAVTDADRIAAIVAAMRDKQVCIADGHHRYETALNYYNETKNPAAAHHLMTFVNTHNEGLIVLPTHRLVKQLKDFRYPEFLRSLKEHFDVARLAFDDEAGRGRRLRDLLEGMALEAAAGGCAFGMYFADGAFYLATLRDRQIMDERAADHGTAWRLLDVAVLHTLVLDAMLGIDAAALAAQTHVEYIKDFGPATDRAIGRIDAGDGQALFLLNPTGAREVEQVAAGGEKMPQKSTFFYPKIFSGLVMNRI